MANRVRTTEKALAQNATDRAFQRALKGEWVKCELRRIILGYLTEILIGRLMAASSCENVWRDPLEQEDRVNYCDANT